jgi:hypothetical protein
MSKHLLYLSLIESRARNSKNPLTQTFSKFFSQNDEDFILNSILERLSPTELSFIEFGPGDGLENNTISLLSQGWRGIWVGNEKLKIDISNKSGLLFLKEWVTIESIKNHISTFKKLNPYLISMDLDGNDYYFMEYLLENGVLPKLIIQEYNGNFPFEVEWVQAYNPEHNWDGTNYYGASLLAYINLFKKHNYTLLCCNLTGINAFFVSNDLMDKFLDLLVSDKTKYVPPLGIQSQSQSISNIKVIQEIINRLK